MDRALGMMSEREHMEGFLEFELALAQRHRFYITVMMIASCSESVSLHGVLELLGGTVRQCDFFFRLPNCSAVILSHTDAQEGLRVVERYRSQYNGDVDLRFSLASYPHDGGSNTASIRSGDLLELAADRLEMARRGRVGEVVAAGWISPPGPGELRRTHHAGELSNSAEEGR